jgi:farnesyl diphosphate synthase
MFRNKAQREANGRSLGKCCNAVAGHQVSALWVSLSALMDCVVSLGKETTIPCETRLAMNTDKLTESTFKPGQSANLSTLRERVENKLERLLSNSKKPLSPTLTAAMHYACMSGGKRMRAQLVYGGGLCTGASLEVMDFPAAAIEMMHAYSLVHDDLPAMDDDELRRGLPTCHVRYNEATAILAGDALQTEAIDTLLGREASEVLNVSQQLLITQTLSRAAGAAGMVGGQMLDLEAEDSTTHLDVNRSRLEIIHKAKTSALIKAAVQMGALCAADIPNDTTLTALGNYGEKIGLAFQVVDDILDVESDTETLGKPVGSDEGLNKLTYPVLLGLDASKQYAQDLHDEAIASLAAFSDNALLVELAANVVKRNH